jgi:hypothetical protein
MKNALVVLILVAVISCACGSPPVAPTEVVQPTLTSVLTATAAPTITETPTETTVVPTATLTPTKTPTPTRTSTPTETATPDPIEAIGNDFWEALETARGGTDWNNYLQWDRSHHHWLFSYAVDGTAIRNVPMPGLEGVTADLAVRAYYYDTNGDRQTILVAMIIRLPDGSFINTPRLYQTWSQAEIYQEMIDHPSIFQIGEYGQYPGAVITPLAELQELCGGDCTAPPGWAIYQQFLEANQTALNEFFSTGSSSLEIILPSGQVFSGGYNIFPSMTPTP